MKIQIKYNEISKVILLKLYDYFFSFFLMEIVIIDFLNFFFHIK